MTSRFGFFHDGLLKQALTQNIVPGRGTSSIYLPEDQRMNFLLLILLNIYILV